MSAEAEMAMISALSALGSRTAALERLDNLELRTGATALTLIHRGVILWEEGKRRDALECFERAFSLNTFSEKDFFEKVRELYSHVRANKSPDRLSAVLPSMLEFRKGNTQFGKL